MKGISRLAAKIYSDLGDSLTRCCATVIGIPRHPDSPGLQVKSPESKLSGAKVKPRQL